MRGLLFVGGMAPDIQIASLFFDAIDIVVAADSGIVTAQKSGYTPDFVIGDMDSIPNKEILCEFMPNQILFLSPDKDITDTEAAISFLREQKVSEIVMIGGTGGRIDHFFAIKKIMEGNSAPDTWIGSENLVFVCDKERNRSRLQVSGLQKTDAVSIFAAPGTSHLCKSAGLHWPIDNLLWDTDEYSLSNRCDEGSFVFEALHGRFIVVLPLLSRITVSSV